MPTALILALQQLAASRGLTDPVLILASHRAKTYPLGWWLRD